MVFWITSNFIIKSTVFQRYGRNLRCDWQNRKSMTKRLEHGGFFCLPLSLPLEVFQFGISKTPRILLCRDLVKMFRLSIFCRNKSGAWSTKHLRVPPVSVFRSHGRKVSPCSLPYKPANRSRFHGGCLSSLVTTRVLPHKSHRFRHPETTSKP